LLHPFIINQSINNKILTNKDKLALGWCAGIYGLITSKTGVAAQCKRGVAEGR
jgi:hypothetical protein